MRTTRSIVVLGALLWASAFSPRALAEKSVCDEKVKSLANPYKHALVLLEQERSQLAAQHLRYFEPMRVIYKSLQMWDPVLEDEQLSEILTNIRKDDMRIRAFRLDAGFRATNEAFAGKPFGKVLDQALDASSKLRFETGVYTDTQDIAADLEKIREAAKAKGKKVKISKAFQDQSDQEVEKGKEAYIEFLRGAGWIESKDTFKLIEQATSILATLSEKQELQTFKKTIPAYIEKLIKSLEKDEFDMNDLEGGVHPLRRHLRWIAIMLQSLNMFVPMENGKAKDIQGKPFIPKPKKDFGKTVKNDPAVVKYSIINNSGVLERAIYIDKGVYEYLTYFIGIFGRCKDSGQRVERFAHIFLETGEAKNQEEAMAMAEELASNHPDQIDFRKVAPKVEQELKDSGLLEELQDEVVNGIAARLAEIRGG